MGRKRKEPEMVAGVVLSGNEKAFDTRANDALIRDNLSRSDVSKEPESERVTQLDILAAAYGYNPDAFKMLTCIVTVDGMGLEGLWLPELHAIVVTDAKGKQGLIGAASARWRLT